jgi:hypothetical protein
MEGGECSGWVLRARKKEDYFDLVMVVSFCIFTPPKPAPSDELE